MGLEQSNSSVNDVLDELRQALGRATQLLERLEGAESAPQAPVAENEAELVRRLESTEVDLGEISRQLVDAENQRGRLMNLYVATYQLHATLDVQEVTSTIAEIARDLLGAERYLLLLNAEDEDSSHCEVAMTSGVGADELAYVDGSVYLGGDPGIDRTLEDGVMRVEPEDGSSALAVVPLQVQGEVVGALVILKLFDHKPALTPHDKDLLDLLAAHAASALLAARVYSATDRRLRSLESLVQLVK